MNKKFFGSLGAVLTGATLTFGQTLPPVIEVIQAEPVKEAPAANEPAKKDAAPKVDANPVVVTEAPVAYDDAAGSTRARFWAGAEYLLWWTKDSPLPVATAVSMPTPPFGGQIPAGSVVVQGAQDLDLGQRHGGRFSLGADLGSDGVFSADASYFFLASETVNEAVVSSGAAGTRYIGAPTFSTLAGGAPRIGPTAPFSIATINGPGAPGAHSLHLESRLEGGELNAAWNVGGGNLRLGLLVGFRYFQLEEDLQLDRVGRVFLSVVPGPNIFFNVNSVRAYDRFENTNTFFGPQLGARVAFEGERLSLRAAVKVAIGEMSHSTFITGQAFIPATSTTPFGGATYAQPSNIGQYETDEFSVIPEVTINVGYNIGRFARLSVGYSYLYATNVLRPGNQIDPTINPTRSAFPFIIPDTGPVRPTFTPVTSNFWAQGVNFGLEFRY